MEAGVTSFTFWFGRTKYSKISRNKYLFLYDIFQNVVPAVIAVTVATGCSVFGFEKEQFVSFLFSCHLSVSFLVETNAAMICFTCYVSDARPFPEQVRVWEFVSHFHPVTMTVEILLFKKERS